MLSSLLVRERYDAIFTLLPTAETHGHHRAATLLALEAVSNLPVDQRPLTFGVEPRSTSDQSLTFSGLPEEPLTHGRHEFEQFWLFEASGKAEDRRLQQLQTNLNSAARSSAW